MHAGCYQARNLGGGGYEEQGARLPPTKFANFFNLKLFFFSDLILFFSSQ